MARRRASADAAHIASLQARASENSAYAAQVHSVEDEVTRVRQARKARTNALADVVIVASVLFGGSFKWLIALKAPAGAQWEVGRQLESGSGKLDAGTSKRAAGTGKQGAEGAKPIRLHGRLAAAASRPGPAVDLEVVDRIIAAQGRSSDAAIPILQAIQTHFRFLPDDALARVCEKTDVTPAQLAGTSSFYARFRRSPVGEHIVRVCHGTACHVAGARQITDELRRQLQIPDGADTDPTRTFTIDEVACLGCCTLAPVLMVDERTAGRLTPSTACRALDGAREPEPV
jgi:NADH:ubiquinone oxidoreductase subunit E